MPQPNFDVREAHIKARIPGSIYFNFAEIMDHNSPYNFMLPNENDFQESMKQMGVKKTDTIVCYDSLNLLAAPRVSWMMRAYGAKNVFVMNGPF